MICGAQGFATMFRDGALEVHLALLQPQFWKRHSKRRKELDVSVATDIACGSIFHIKTYPPRSASDQGHQATLVSPTLGLSEPRGSMYLAGTSRYAAMRPTKSLLFHVARHMILNIFEV